MRDMAVLTVFALAAISLILSMRIIPEYRRLVIFRLGRPIGAKGPGIILAVPFIDMCIPVDLREKEAEVSSQKCFTQDNHPVSVDLLCNFKVADPVASVVQVRDVSKAIGDQVGTLLPGLVKKYPLTDLRAKLERICEDIQYELSDSTRRWGIQINSVKVRNAFLDSTVS